MANLLFFIIALLFNSRFVEYVIALSALEFRYKFLNNFKYIIVINSSAVNYFFYNKTGFKSFRPYVNPPITRIGNIEITLEVIGTYLLRTFIYKSNSFYILLEGAYYLP